VTPSAAEQALAEAGLADVPRETLERLIVFVRLVGKWQKAQNLVASSTLPDIWHRHVADSAQLVGLKPDAIRWLDLGSGGGFPGIVIAVLLADQLGAKVHLVESDRRKCAFLRTAVRETGAPAEIHEGRIEAIVTPGRFDVDVVTARAAAPLDRLLAWSAPVIGAGAAGLFPKGRDFRREVTQAAAAWDFDLVEYPSRIDDGVILEITRLRPRPA
jgi:16S rRNA (guanine527-N7)-methyltransferase